MPTERDAGSGHHRITASWTRTGDDHGTLGSELTQWCGDPLPFSEFEAGFRPMSRRAESLTVVLPTYHLVSCKLLTTAKFPLWPINQNLRTIRLSVPDPTACAFRMDTSRQLRPSASTNSHSFPLQCYPHVSAQSLATTPSSREVFTSVSRSNHSYPGWDRIRG